MTKKSRSEKDKERFLDWFHYKSISRLDHVPRSYIAIADELNLLDLDYIDAAHEWALTHIIDHLQNIAKRATNAYFSQRVRRELREIKAYMQGGGNFPKSMESLFADFQMKALLALSKPLETISNL